MPKPVFKSDVISYYYDKLTESNPEYAKPIKAWRLLDESELESGYDLNKAKLAYDEAPNLPVTWHNLGRVHYFLKNDLEAEKFYKKFIITSFVSSECYKEYAECLQSLKHYDEALIQYQNAIDWAKANCPDDNEDLSEYLTAKANLLRSLGNEQYNDRYIQEAIDLSGEAIRTFSNSWSYQINSLSLSKKGTELEKAGNKTQAARIIDEAVKVARKGVDVFPDDYLVHNALGVCLFAKGDYEGALREYELWEIYNTGRFSVLYSCKAEALIKLGRYPEALENLRKTQEAFAREKADLDEFRTETVTDSLAKQAEIASLVSEYIITAQQFSDYEQISHEKVASSPYGLKGLQKAPQKAYSFKNKYLESSALSSGMDFLAEKANNSEESAYIGMIRQLQLGLAEMNIELSELKGKCQPIFEDKQIADSNKAKIDYIKANSALEQYYNTFMDICTSHYISAKAASGPYVKTDHGKGIPGVDTLVSIIPIEAVSAAVNLLHLGVKTVNYVNNYNNMRAITGKFSSVGSFESIFKDLTIEICLEKQQIIRDARIDDRGALGMFEYFRSIKGKVLTDNYATAPQRLAYTDAMKVLRLIYTNYLSPETNFDEVVLFVCNSRLEQNMLKSINPGHMGASSGRSAAISRGSDYDDRYEEHKYASSSKKSVAISKASGQKCIIMNVQTDSSHPDSVLKLLYPSELDSLLGLNGEIDLNDTGGFEHIFDFSTSC